MPTQLAKIFDTFSTLIPDESTFNDPVKHDLELLSLRCEESMDVVDQNPVVPINQIRNKELKVSKWQVFDMDSRLKGTAHSFKFSFHPVTGTYRRKGPNRTIQPDIASRRVRASPPAPLQLPRSFVPVVPLYASVSVQTSPTLMPQPMHLPPALSLASQLPGQQYHISSDMILQALNSISGLVADATNPFPSVLTVHPVDSGISGIPLEELSELIHTEFPGEISTPPKTTDVSHGGSPVKSMRTGRKSKAPLRFDDNERLSSTPRRNSGAIGKRGRMNSRKVFGAASSTCPTFASPSEALAAGAACSCCQKTLTAKELARIPKGVFPK